MAVAVVVWVGVMGLKFREYWTTDLLAILSDALESIIEVLAAVLAFGSLLVPTKPPDETHRMAVERSNSSRRASVALSLCWQPRAFS
jgi:divalent metal cation (Fe/Co/Zn/Cd) transporter